MLQENVKSRIRVHLGVPVLGLQNSGFALGYRFTNVMGLLEYRMNNLQPFEEAALTGVPTGAAILYGTPAAGNTVTLTVNALAPLTYTVTAADALATDPLGSVAQNLSIAIAASATYAPIVRAAYAPSIKQPYTTSSGVNSTLILQSTSAATFTFTCAFSGATSFVSYLQGVLPQPSTTFTEDSVTATGYVAICDYLESKVATASDLMKFTKADVVNFNRDETGSRMGLYRLWRKRLAEFLGVPLYPMGAAGVHGGGGTGLVV